MNTFYRLAALFLCGIYFGLTATNALAIGRIVVTWDEWVFNEDSSETCGFCDPNDGGIFARNIASWFTGGAAGSFLGYSDNARGTFNDPALVNSLALDGHSYTLDTSIPFTVSDLLGYDGIFAGGPSPTIDMAILTDYVNAGGNVVVFGGYGLFVSDLASNEALYWNEFLSNFGLAFDSFYNGVKINQVISSSHPLFQDVDHLVVGNGQPVLDLAPADPRNMILVSQGGQGAYAVFDPVPIPSALWLFGSGLLGLIGIARRRSMP